MRRLAWASQQRCRAWRLALKAFGADEKQDGQLPHVMTAKGHFPPSPTSVTHVLKREQSSRRKAGGLELGLMQTCRCRGSEGEE